MPSYLIRKILGLCSLLFIVNCIPQSSYAESVQQVINKALKLKLHEDLTWIKLLHYQGTISNQKSDVKDKDFFNSKHGSYNSRLELIETLKSFKRNKGTQKEEHPQCRFIARFNWLQEQLKWQESLYPKIRCSKFQKWSHYGKVKSLSIIFATGYLDNPASFFGHPLIKFNLNESFDANNLMDLSLNYGAITEDDDPLTYSLKGLFGGYDASFTHLRFFYHGHNYSENELRDMWEYRLNLSKKEIDFLIQHSWEMLGRKMTYFFSKDNCAHHMAELLNLVIKEKILPKNVPYSIPHTLFDRISSMQHNEASLVNAINYIPSRQTRMATSYNNLTKKEKVYTKGVINKTHLLSSENFKLLKQSSQIAIADSLIDYSMFLIAKDNKDLELKKDKKKYLLARLLLPPKKPIKISPATQPPHKGQRPVLTRISVGQLKEESPFIDLQIRPAYYDLLSPDTGRLPYSSLAIARVEIRVKKEQISIREFDLFNVTAFNIANTDLPKDGSFAWKFRLGLTSQTLRCNSCQVLSIQTGIGKALLLNDFLTFYSFFGQKAQTAKNNFGTYGLQAESGLLITIQKNWRILVNQSYTQFYNEKKSYQDTLKIEQRFGTSKSWDIRLSYYYQNESEMKLSYSYYW